MLSLTDERMRWPNGGRAAVSTGDDEEEHDGAPSGPFFPVAQAFKMGSKVASPFLLKNGRRHHRQSGRGA
ncbi:MAG: hypothetical protein IPL47_02370 [Phyllobacteriaceae bacterium]|nr:hypothetical protein [Phyllobacteriaceae bacterium]